MHEIIVVGGPQSGKSSLVHWLSGFTEDEDGKAAVPASSSSPSSHFAAAAAAATLKRVIFVIFDFLWLIIARRVRRRRRNWPVSVTAVSEQRFGARHASLGDVLRLALYETGVDGLDVLESDTIGGAVLVCDGTRVDESLRELEAWIDVCRSKRKRSIPCALIATKADIAVKEHDLFDEDGGEEMPVAGVAALDRFSKKFAQEVVHTSW
jgi:hypothetical protein